MPLWTEFLYNSSKGIIKIRAAKYLLLTLFCWTCFSFFIVTYGESTEQTNEADDIVTCTSRYMSNYKLCYTCQTPSQETECVAGTMEATDVNY